MSKSIKLLAAMTLLAAAGSAHAQTNAAPGSANDVTGQSRSGTNTGPNDGTDQGIKVPDRTDDSISGKAQRDNPAIRQGSGRTSDQGPVQVPPAGTAHPKALPGTGPVPKGS